MAADLPAMVVWDPDEVSILVARGSRLFEVIREVRALLTIDLGAPEGTGNLLLCYCGMQVKLPAELVTCGVAAEAC
ncbi:hypothetical protein [Streptomyces sp. NPDC093094]|uniref:hypothetical protein n=1 Tax=Streptomyces sp. NPDC093094 TaxID=3366026 RepID=UPI00380A32C2